MTSSSTSTSITLTLKNSIWGSKEDGYHHKPVMRSTYDIWKGGRSKNYHCAMHSFHKESRSLFTSAMCSGIMSIRRSERLGFG